jgi:hypothetical protein
LTKVQYYWSIMARPLEASGGGVVGETSVTKKTQQI